MVRLISHELAISSQIESTERRAKVRRKKYNEKSNHSKIVDAFIKKQVSITNDIEMFTNKASNEEEVDVTCIVSDFTNQESLKKHRNKSKVKCVIDSGTVISPILMEEGSSNDSNTGIPSKIGLDNEDECIDEGVK